MPKPFIFFDIPKLSYEDVVSIYLLMQEIIFVFDENYRHQMIRYYEQNPF